VEGLYSDVYSVHLRLRYQIPEFLPIYGKKARIYYHGIPNFCTNCYVIGKTIRFSSIISTLTHPPNPLLGHQKSDCSSDSKDWWSYIVQLKTAKVPESYFGSWVEINSKFEESKPSTSENSKIELPTDPNLIALLVKTLQTPAAASTPLVEKEGKKKRDRSPSSSSSSSSDSSAEAPPALENQFAPGRGFRGGFRGGRRGRYSYNRGFGRGFGRGFNNQAPADNQDPPKEKKKPKKDKKDKKKKSKKSKN